MIHAETTAQGAVLCKVKGIGKQIMEEAVAVMAHMGSLLARETGCTPEDALELLKAFARVQMRDREPGGEEARPS